MQLDPSSLHARRHSQDIIWYCYHFDAHNSRHSLDVIWYCGYCDTHQPLRTACKAIDIEVPKPSNLKRPLKGFKGNPVYRGKSPKSVECTGENPLRVQFTGTKSPRALCQNLKLCRMNNAFAATKEVLHGAATVETAG